MKTVIVLLVTCFICACTTAPPPPVGKSLGLCLFNFEQGPGDWFLVVVRDSPNYAQAPFLAKADFFLTGVESGTGKTLTWPVNGFIVPRDQARIRVKRPDNIKEIIGAAPGHCEAFE